MKLRTSYFNKCTLSSTGCAVARFKGHHRWPYDCSVLHTPLEGVTPQRSPRTRSLGSLRQARQTNTKKTQKKHNINTQKKIKCVNEKRTNRYTTTQTNNTQRATEQHANKSVRQPTSPISESNPENALTPDTKSQPEIFF